MAKRSAARGGSAEERLRSAHWALQGGRTDEAIRMLRPLLRRPLGPSDSAGLAALLRKAEHPAAGEVAARTEAAIGELDEGSAEDQLAAAQAWTALDRLPEARAAVLRSIALEPANPTAAMMALRVFLPEGDVAGAEAAVEQVFAALESPRQAMSAALKAYAVSGYPEPARRLLARLRAMEGGDTDPELAFIAAGLEGRDAAGQGAMATHIFDAFAASYDDNLERLGNNGPAMISRLLDRLKPPRGRVLDAGCGTGLCAPFLRRRASRLTGCDISIPMLEKARAKGVYDALVRSDLGEPLTLPDGQFDLIVLADVLTYFGDLRPVLRGLAGLLAPGGWLLCTVEEAEAGPDFALTPTGRYRHQAEGLARMFKDAGLSGPQHCLRDRLRSEFGHPVPGLAVAAQKLALFG